MAKIVHLTSVATTYHVRIFAKQCRSLAASGNEVVLLCTHDRDEVVDGVHIQTVGRPTSRLRRMTITTACLFLTAVRLRADLYVVHDPELTPVAWLLARIGFRVVYDMHENTPKQVLTKHWVPRPVRKLVAAAVHLAHRVMLPGTPVVFAESSYEKHYTFVRRATTVLNMPPHGHAVEKYARPTLGYIGGVTPLRGSRVTFAALERLHSRGVHPDFECIGPVTDRHAHELQALGESLRPGEVRLPGYLPSNEGWSRIARCHVGLAVLSNAPNYYESFPGKMFEYMSFGVPVIVSDFPLYRDVVDRVRCGICVAPDSPGDLAEAIEWMLSHPREAAEMGSRGKQAVDATYNWDTEYAKLLDFYDDVLAPAGVRVKRATSDAALQAA